MSVDRTHSYPTGEDLGETPISSAFLVVALDCEQPTKAGLRISLSEVDSLQIARGTTCHHERTTENGGAVLVLTLPDRHLSSDHARISKTESGDGYILTDSKSKNGTFINGSRTKKTKLHDLDIVAVGSTLLMFRQDIARFPREPADVDAASFSDPMATLSPHFARMSAKAARCAATDLAILLTGESGTGKEVAARWLHKRSGRRGEFIAINCGALPETLIESELFGAKRGAFSGADRDRVGLVQAADGGTLFLDEIAELPLASQVKLLRVLQEREVTPVGDTVAQKVDIRVISATLKDVDEAVTDGRFRPDLLARIAGFRFDLPRLADRPEDIGLLIGRMVERHKDANLSDAPIRFERTAARGLLQYEWPLNVRELEQVLHSAIALADNGKIATKDLPTAIQAASVPQRAGARGESQEEEVFRAELVTQLRAHRGNISAVARKMGKARVQVRRWCERFGLDASEFRNG